MKTLEFIQETIKDYRIGAFTVSSRYTVDAIVSHIPSDAKRIVEYGAGEGVITKKILEKMPADGRLVAIETNKALLGQLRSISSPRLTAVQGDVVALSQNFRSFGMPHADAVVSGIPFSFLSQAEREDVIRGTSEQLSPKGVFIVYQYSPLILPLLKKYFGRVRVQYEVRNFLPYVIMVASSAYSR